MPAFLLILFWLTMAIGWFMNLVTIISGFDTISLAELIVRLVGLPVVFLGAIMGWFF